MTKQSTAAAAVAVLSIAAAAGCADLSRPDCTLTLRKIVLTHASPRDRRLGVALLRVEEDGTAVIGVRRTAETLAARPGEYFLGDYHPPWNVRTFGERGLYLASSDPATQTAVVVRHEAH